MKQKILGHEYEEVIRDQHSGAWPLGFDYSPGKCIGLGADDILNTKPIPSTTATLYCLGLDVQKKHWLEGLAAMSMTEWNQGRPSTGRFGRWPRAIAWASAWVEHLGITLGRSAEVESAPRSPTRGHVDMFLPVWEEFGKGENER